MTQREWGRETQRKTRNERVNETIRSAAPDTIRTAINANIVPTIPHSLGDIPSHNTGWH